jgi:hypothetical protein
MINSSGRLLLSHVSYNISNILYTNSFSVTKEKYAIDVQAVKDEEDLFNTARVAITNTGKLPLTNVIVNYGAAGSNNKFDKILAMLLLSSNIGINIPNLRNLLQMALTTERQIAHNWSSYSQITRIYD